MPPPSPHCYLFLLFVTSSALHTCAADPLGLLETYTRLARQGHRYEEGHNTDTPLRTVLRQRSYDFVIVGGGSAGSVIASRLSENPKWQVLLLEAGRDENFLMDIPLVCQYWQLTDYNWGYTTEPQEGACLGMDGGRCRWPRGKSLGGSSSINYMIYTRGNKQDYDHWAELGNTGWSYDEVLPYFLKSENNQIPELKKSRYHSSGGYLNVENVPFRTPLVKAFMRAGREMGFPEVDTNGASQLGFSYLAANIRNGTRCSASKAFLRPARHRKNLHISMNTRVTKILIDPKTRRTLGVEFVKNRKLGQVKVRREVVVSAGALNSPQILMLSGIGPREHLEELGISVLRDLKVGHNLQEHVAYIGLTVLVNATVGIVSERLFRPPTAIPIAAQYLHQGRGPMTLLGTTEALAFVRTKLAEDARPDVELLYVTGGMMSDGGDVVKRAFGITDDLYDAVWTPINSRDAWTIFPILMRPKSRGIVKLKDNNPFHHPKFYANFFSDPRDMKTLIEGIKMSLQLIETAAFQKYGSKLHRIPFPGCAELPFGSDLYWECAARHLTGNIYHPVGTCKMGPAGDGDAVVDPRLMVHGITGLRVADASIMPVIPTAHTNAPVYMIGEKAADMIKEDWK